MTEATELRAPGRDIFTNARAGSFTLTVDSDALGLVGSAGDWSAWIVRKEYGDAADTLITPTVAVDTFANAASFSWTDADADTIAGSGVSRFAGWYTFRHDDGDLVYEVKGRFVMDRNGVATTTSTAATLSMVDESLTLTGTVSVSALALTGPRRPLPLGSRMIALGDSITIGTGSTLASGVSITGDSRQAPGGWFSRMCGQYPNRYYKVRNAGIGGDPVGGIGTLTAPVAAGANTFTIRLTNGLKPYSTAVGFYVGGYPSGEGKFASSIVDNGDGTYTYTLTGTLASAHAAGAPVGWGMHGRLQSDVIDWAPETVPVLAGTNDSTGITNGTVTATAVGAAVAELGARLRTAGIEPLFLEVLPRSTNQAAVVRLNDALAQECRAGSYHLVPTYRVFAGGDGGWASGTYTADGTHPSDLGHQMLADTVHGYLVGVPLRITSTPLAAYDTDPTNLFANACFLTGSAGGGGIVPASVTFTPFVFAGTCVPNIEDPAAGDGITGKWATLTGTNLNGNAAFDLPVTAQSVGDLVYLAARVKTTGMGGGATAIVQFLTGSFTIDLAYQVVDDFDATLMVTTTRLAAVSLSKLRIQLLGTGGSNGKLWVAQPLMRNLTTLGRAA